jgi:diguanylate cyclase (GGDEF)-like protein
MLNKWFKVLAVILSILAISVWIYNYQIKKVKIHTNALNSHVLIQELIDTHYKLNDEILKSSLFNLYNYNKMNDVIKKYKQVIENIHNSPIYTNSSYKNTKELTDSFISLSFKKIDDVELFKRLNGQVKNSLTFITSNLEKLDPLSDKNKKRFLSILSQIYTVKNNMQNTEIQMKIDSLNLSTQTKKDNQIFIKLLEIHVEHLRKKLPSLIKLSNQLLHNQDTEKQITNLKLTIDRENNLAYNKLDREFYLIATFTLLTLIIIMYYIILLERDKKQILRLQDDYKKSVTIDKVTGLKNRNAYIYELDQNKEYTVILIDILEFSSLNGLYGFEVGDSVLHNVANKIREVLTINQNNAKVYKVGADQFAITLPKCSKEDALSLANTVVQTIEKKPLVYEKIGQTIPIQVYCGISSKAPYLINSALASKTTLNDYHKKIAFFDSSLDKTKEIKQNILMVQKIKDSIANDNITILFQPLVDLKNHKIIKYEALVRLKDQDNYISPFFFLELSKKAKLYPFITEIVLSKSIEAVKRKDIDVSVNLSIEDILHKETYDFIIKTLNTNPKLASRVTFELLETEEIQDFKVLKSFVDEVKSFGCKIAIDDFGSGYSNYNYLLELDVDILKIDGSLIKNIDKSENNKLVVQSIVKFTKLSGIKTVAEFVENKEIEEVIIDLGVDLAQGYYYSPPKLL